MCFLSASPLFATQKDTIFVADYGVTPDTYENQTERLEAAIADCKQFNSKVLVFERDVMTCGLKAQPTKNLYNQHLFGKRMSIENKNNRYVFRRYGGLNH